MQPTGQTRGIVDPRGIVDRLAALSPSGLLARVRWLFLLFALLAGSTTLIAVARAAVDPTRRVTAFVSVAVWLAWLLHRYTHPDAGVATDLIGPVAITAMGWAMRDVALINGVAYVSLFFRVLYRGRWEAAANGVLYFASVHLTMVMAADPAASGVKVAVDLVSFVAVALVMHALGDVAGRHEAATRRERVLTAVSARLLQARTLDQVHRVAAEGTLELAAAPGASASVWRGGEVLGLVASAGPDLFDLRRAPLDATPEVLLQQFMQGRPFVLDPDETREIERAFGQPPRFHHVLVGPLLQDGNVVGALVLTSPGPLDAHLLDYMERFTNELTLATERATLIGDLETANTELRYAGKMKDRFLSTVSHELRTPLTSIQGFAQTLRRKADDLSDEQRDRFLEIIERQSLRQQRLIDDLLISSRMKAGRLTAEPTDTDVCDVIARVVEELQVRPADIRMPGNAPVWAHVDPMQLHQVVVNLLTNAQKYGAPPYAIEATSTGGTCTITVHDHGPGVPEDFHAELFEAFTQADTGDRRESTGTGLGLAITRNLLGANGGSIVHRPDLPGAGFEIVLPAVDARVRPTRGRTRAASDGRDQPAGT